MDSVASTERTKSRVPNLNGAVTLHTSLQHHSLRFGPPALLSRRCHSDTVTLMCVALRARSQHPEWGAQPGPAEQEMLSQGQVLGSNLCSATGFLCDHGQVMCVSNGANGTALPRRVNTGHIRRCTYRGGGGPAKRLRSTDCLNCWISWKQTGDSLHWCALSCLTHTRHEQTMCVLQLGFGFALQVHSIQWLFWTQKASRLISPLTAPFQPPISALTCRAYPALAKGWTHCRPGPAPLRSITSVSAGSSPD